MDSDPCHFVRKAGSQSKWCAICCHR